MRKVNKCFETLLSLGIALAMITPAPALAWGKKKASDIANKADFLDTAIREFNAKYADVTFGPNTTSSYCSYADHTNNFSERLTKATNELCESISPLFENGMTCGDFIAVSRSKIGWTDTQTYTDFLFFDSYSCSSEGHSQFTASLTPKAQQLMQSSFFYDSGNASVDYNVRAIQSALSELELLPRQRKALDGYFNATDAFIKSIDVEKAKAAKGEDSKPMTHRSFVAQANLLVAYHRYLKDDLAELALFGSARNGVSQSNQKAVEIINSSIDHLVKAYGLDTDVSAKQVADYGRVLLDLMNTFSLSLTLNEKANLRPVMVQLGKTIATSEAYGDVGAHDDVIVFKNLWEAQSFQDFLTDKLSIADDKSTTLILNLSAATYKIGLSANVDIRTFDARDAARIKSQKGRQ